MLYDKYDGNTKTTMAKIFEKVISLFLICEWIWYRAVIPYRLFPLQQHFEQFHDFYKHSKNFPSKRGENNTNMKVHRRRFREARKFVLFQTLAFVKKSNTCVFECLTQDWTVPLETVPGFSTHTKILQILKWSWRLNFPYPTRMYYVCSGLTLQGTYRPSCLILPDLVVHSLINLNLALKWARNGDLHVQNHNRVPCCRRPTLLLIRKLVSLLITHNVNTSSYI